MKLRAYPAGRLSGSTTVPGDKSVSHRALMLAGMAVGESRIGGLLEGADVLATAAALRCLGVAIERDAGGLWRVQGVGVGGQPGAVRTHLREEVDSRHFLGLGGPEKGDAGEENRKGDAELRGRRHGHPLVHDARLAQDASADTVAGNGSAYLIRVCRANRA